MNLILGDNMSKKSKRKKINKLKLTIIITLLFLALLSIYEILFSNPNKKDNVKSQETMQNKNNTTDDSKNDQSSTKKQEDNNIKPTFSYSSIPDNIKNKMIGKSMPTDEPISFDSLSYLKLTYYGFDEKTHQGEMIVNSELAPEVVDIFKELYEKKYPIEKINLIDDYDAVDEKSMSDNNTSSFCYRTITGTNVISNHGKGRAIDINPLQNPQVSGNDVTPKVSTVYADRSSTKFGMIRKGDDCYNAFVSRGWSWGGYWKNPDYQHFEK
ncbi:TPA: M15 family metallopeptidase [Clostridioides difficile]|nr:M15 family metallopeptidase [Clostridioides difficile]HBF4438777.1 M15 family metallopeptidase [Clostridioides difficile]HBF4771523.1 M15 family metallopeptidase [Clostridioides difficile]HBF5037473.1 M15 family metallopeptidase [Clostridioides difficile]HBF5410330.1 M15 family metallopeptidase [Clostridioides difficile]